MVVGPLLEHVVPFTLAFFRMSGVFVFAPMLGSISIPTRAKVMLAVAFTFAVYPVLGTPSQTPPDLTIFGALPLVALELLIGVVIGLLGAIPLIAVQMAGHIMGYQMGLSLAQTFNPEMDGNTDVLGQILFLAGLGLYITLGGVDGAYVALLTSFEHVPPGGLAPGAQPLALLVGLLEAGFELALRMSAPVLAITLLLQLAMGVVMKTMPQINILSIGFALKIIGGLVVMVVGAGVALELLGGEIERVTGLLIEWAGGFAHG